MSDVIDIRGDVVEVGDTIAYAATDGRSSGMRVGEVVEIVWAHEKVHTYDHLSSYATDVPTKLRVAVEYSSGYWTPAKPVLIDPAFKRFVRLAR